MIDPVLALLPMAESKHVKGLAITSSERTKIAPGYPSAAEAGLPGFNHSSWYGVWGPKNLPAHLVVILNSAVNAAVQQLDKDGVLQKVGIESVVESSAQFEEFAKRYSSENAALLKAANFEPS